jgi:hypothetical protein
MMWALKVSRSTTAAARRGSVKVLRHSEKGALEAQAMEARSSLAVMIWNSSSAPRGSKVADLVEAEQVEPGVAAEDAGELFVIGGFGELVDQLGAGEVADPPASFGGDSA